MTMLVRARDKACGFSRLALCAAFLLLASGLAGAQDCGDCNGDGSIDITDALEMARIAAGLIMPSATQRALCDVDANGSIIALDVLQLAQFAVGLPLVLTCPPQGVPFDTGIHPLTVHVADVNMDGDLDILVGFDPPGVVAGGVRIHYGATDPATGSTSIDWSIPPMATEDLIVGSGVSRILSGDIDADGRIDLVTIDFEQATFTLHLGIQPCPGSFVSFAAGVTVPVPGGLIWDGELGDMDLDGDLDLVTIGSSQRALVFEFSSETTAFNATASASMRAGLGATSICTLVAPSDPIDLTLADVTGNGLPDVVMCYVGSGAVVVFEQVMTDLTTVATPTMNPDRGVRSVFSSCFDDEDVPTFRLYSTGSGGFPTNVHSGDFNRDGAPDILAINSFAGSAAILLGDGEGSFGAAAETGLALGALSLALQSQVIDLNRDGVLDLLVASEATDQLIYLEGRQPLGGNFSFLPARRFVTSLDLPGMPATPTNPAGMAIADLDEDGANDIVVATTRTGQFQILDLTRFGGLVPRAFVAFNTAINYELGANPLDITSSDVLGFDGFSDIITANGNGSFSLFQGFDVVGAGLRYPSLDVTTPGLGSMPVAVTAGDFDGLPGPDLAFADQGLDRVLVYLHNGDGTAMAPAGPAPFLAPQIIALPMGCVASDIKAGILNADALLDIVVACRGRNSVVVLANTAATPGVFSTMTEFDTGPAIDPMTRACSPGNFAGCGPEIIALGNVDGLLGLDIVTGNNDSYDLAILLSDGLGGFALSGNPEATPPTGTPASVNGLCVTDFDGDHFLDYVVGHANPGGTNSAVNIFPGNGQGGFMDPLVGGTSVAVAVGLGLSDVACADLDADGDPDLAVSSQVDGVVSVIRNRVSEGMGVELDPADCAAGGSPESLVIADVSGDGQLDIITANPLTGSPTGSVTYIPGRTGGRFLCTLVESIPAGTIDADVAPVDDDYQDDVILSTYNQVMITYGTGQSGGDTLAEAVFEFDPITNPTEHALVADVFDLAGTPIFASTPGDFDHDGDTDVAVLLGGTLVGFFNQYTGPGIQIFWNDDATQRGSFSGLIDDGNHLFPVAFWPVLPLLDPTGAELPPIPSGAFNADRAWDIQAADVNRDGLDDFIALIPQTGFSNAHLVVTFTPGLSGDPTDLSFSPTRWIDFQGFTFLDAAALYTCGFDSGHVDNDYTPAVLPLGCDPASQVTQFSFDLGAVDARNFAITDSYPQDGDYEIVVTDLTNSRLQIFTVDYDAPLMTPGRLALDALGVVIPTGYPQGMVMGPTFVALTAGPADITHGDLNDDGRDDMVASIESLGGANGLLTNDQPDCAGAVPGVYGPLDSAARAVSSFVHTGDFNRDGKVDALVSSDTASVASAFYFDELLNPAPVGLLVPRVDHVISGDTPVDMISGDFNNDGFEDVIIIGAVRFTILLGGGG